MLANITTDSSAGRFEFVVERADARDRFLIRNRARDGIRRGIDFGRGGIHAVVLNLRQRMLWGRASTEQNAHQNPPD